TASTTRSNVTPSTKSDAGGGDPVTPNHLIKDVDVTRYAVIVFPGTNRPYFRRGKEGAKDADDLIQRGTAANVGLAALGSGLKTLGEFQALKGRRVAAQNKYHEELRAEGADPFDKPVEKDGSIITAR